MTKPIRPTSHIGVADAVARLLTSLGFDIGDPAIIDTPDRVMRAYKELLSGYEVDVEALLSTEFKADYDELVMVRNVLFYSLCEHHLMPFSGKATVGYIPSEGKVVGLSKLARLVDAHARRLQLQERMTEGIADDLEKHLNPDGIVVIIKAEHLCMCSRGANKPEAEMITSVMRGSLRTDSSARLEAMQLWSK